MEEYTIINNSNHVNYGKYKEHVFDIHKDSYGEESATNILKNSTNILIDSLNQYADINLSNNLLLVGKVQSGKTSNLEMLSALAFDNGFNVLVIYGGYDNYLVNQTITRFSETFNCGEDQGPYILSTNMSNFEFFDDDFIADSIEEGRPIIFISLKRPLALSKVNDCFQKVDCSKFKAFIIDDEGDQASLNTNKSRFPEGSATYNEICKMKSILNEPLYFSVTATPQANIFQPDISRLKPDSIHLIPPANLYTGANIFHLSEKNITIVPDDENLDLSNNILTVSLKTAINHFLISSAILYDLGINKSDMIVHTYRQINGHMILANIIGTYLENFKLCIAYGDDDVNRYMNDIKGIYNNKYFSEEILKSHKWDEKMEKRIIKVVKKVHIIQNNSKNMIDENTLKMYPHKIYIGGDLLQRGITFKHLVTTYFTRWAINGNMDTNLQRARWFGYRNKYINLCRIFTTDEIKIEFANLASIENDLWDQFEEVESGDLNINDIVIDAEDTSLNPTRKNVADYRKTSFGKKWNNQFYGLFDANLVKHNNELFEQLMDKYEFLPSTVGRNDGNASVYYSMIPGDVFIEFIQATDYIFEQHPFNKNDLKKLLEGKIICLELMFYKDLNPYRERSFSKERNYKISALQQGADTVDIIKQKYKGDSFVIVNENLITVQVFNILPKINDVIKNDCLQYMFSIYFPKKKIVFGRS